MSGAVRSSYAEARRASRSEEHTSELQSHVNLVCRLLLEQKILYSPASYMYRESYPRRNGSRQNCCSRAGDERSFFFIDTSTTETDTLSLHDALPISTRRPGAR